MIKTNDKVFVLETKNNFYILSVNNVGLVSHVYYGKHIDLVDFDVTPISLRTGLPRGTATIYDEEKDKDYSMDLDLLEFSFPHKGDYLETPILFKNDKYGYVFDFTYDHYEIRKEILPLKDLPSPYDADEELIIYLKDKKEDIIVELHYLLFSEEDVIARNIVIKNNTKEDLHLLKALSMNLDLLNRDYELISTYGGWISENQRAVQEIKPGTFKIESLTGNTSARHNPLFLIKEKSTTVDQGNVYAVNLMYSGNHYETIELSAYGKLRLMTGINPFCFDYILKENEVFETPFAILSFSDKGLNDISAHMHDFVNKHVTNKNWSFCPRPVAINNWEATAWKFNESRLLSLAKDASKNGVELFVLDDGWFGARDDDFHGLGDYTVNKKKLPHGLNGLAKRINKLGMKFGLWFEPEMVNTDAVVYKEHPEYVIKNNDRTPSFGRHQLVLDLTQKAVQDYIIENVSKVLDSANIEYVKWDMNRNISDIPAFRCGEFYHRYILGLYRVISTLVEKYPHILFENCASGGNRFDLGMTRYFPQTWISDDSDALERINMMSTLTLGYPQSTFSNHVSSAVNNQLLRRTPIETRFNVAYFGVLGFELLFNEMEKVDRNKVSYFLDIYKKHRMTFQYGKMYQTDSFFNHGNEHFLIVKGEKDEIILDFNTLQKPAPVDTYLPSRDLDDEKLYSVKTVQTFMNIKRFGGLVNMILPFHVNPEGGLVNLVSKFKTIDSEHHEFLVMGNVLNNQSLTLPHQWSGTGVGDEVRVLGDFGSRLYIIEEKDEKDSN